MIQRRRGLIHRQPEGPQRTPLRSIQVPAQQVPGQQQSKPSAEVLLHKEKAAAEAADRLLQEEEAGAEAAQRAKQKAASRKARQKQRKQVRQSARICKSSAGPMPVGLCSMAQRRLLDCRWLLWAGHVQCRHRCHAQ